jgi:transglutaminase-like putative cysteine protease
VVIFTLVGGALSFLAEPARPGWAFLRSRAWSLGWNGSTLVVFAWTALDTLRGQALFAGVRFLCFLLVNKLWNRRASRDYLQAYVVSFLMLVAGAALSSDLSYAACFLAYVVFATWTLTLFHLRREMEENYLLKHSDGAQSERVEVERILNSRRIVGGAFLAGTSLVSLGIFLSATLVFFLIPRFGFGFFVAHGRRGAATIGFSDRVDLGEYGLVKDNPQVVMRVELPAGPPSAPLHLRGVSFDRYQHGHWARTEHAGATGLRRWNGSYWFVGLPPKRPLGAARAKKLLEATLEQRVYLDPLDTPVLFGAAQPVAFQLFPSVLPTPIELEVRGAGEIYAVERHVDATGRTFAVERKSGLRYIVYSDLRVPSEAELAALPDTDEYPDDLDPYLQLPADLPPRIAALARTITADASGPYRKAHAIEMYLQRKYRYTLDLKRDERYEPLEDFLFVQRAGHCEYFASAMAILLRAVGVPTRSVNGFLAGEWNGYGRYLAVRQGDAHSWVEVWLDGVGWVTFDPTPGNPAAAAGGVFQSARQLFDTLELSWFKYVIEYDLGKQADLVSGVRDWGHAMAQGSSLRRLPGARWLALLAALVGALALGLRAPWRRATARRGRPEHVAANHAFARALRALERRGHGRRAAETGRELALRVERAGDPGAAPFSALVELYYASRFGNAPVPADELERLAQAVVRPPSPDV